MSAGSPTPKRTGGSKPKGAVRAKSGCYTCRIRRKKCDEKPDAEGSCQTCVRLRLQCLGFGAKRPDWMREGNSVTELRGKIKGFLAQNGMIKGHSASSASLVASPPPHTPGASNSSDSASPPSLTLPSLVGSSTAAAQGLSTPLSATSTLGPDALNHESPPNSPLIVSASHHHPNDCSFPPNHTHARTFNDHTMGESRPHHSAHGQASGSTSGVLLLSNGRPTGVPSLGDTPSGTRPSRRNPTGNAGAYSSQQSGLLLSLDDEPMDAISTNGTAHSTAHGHTTTRRSHSPSLQRRRTTDLLGYGHHNMDTFTSRSYSVTAASSHTRPYQTSPCFSTSASASAPSSTAPSSGLIYYYPHGPSSNAHSTANAINSTSNTVGTSPHLSASISSVSVSPPLTSLSTPFTPYNSLPSLPAVPPMYSPGAMDYPVPPSTSSSTTMSSSTRMSNDVLPSPNSDTGIFDFNDMRWNSVHHSTTGTGSNYGSTTGTSPHVRVKPEPIDNIGLDTDAYTADDYAPYRGLGLFSRYSDDGYATPVINTNNATPGRANNDVSANFTIDNNNSNYYSSAPPPTNTNAYTSYDTFTPHVTRPVHSSDYGTYVHHASADANVPYLSGPQLSPDSPTPPYTRGNPILGYNSESNTPHMGSYAHAHQSGQFALHSGSGRHNGGVGQGGLGGGHAVNGHGNGHGSSGSSWLRNDENYVPERLPSVHHTNQAQVPTPYGFIHGNNVNGGGLGTFQASPTIRTTSLLPPSMHSSFSPLYYGSLDVDMDATFDPQQLNSMSASYADASAQMTHGYYETGPAPITDLQAFYDMPTEMQQQYYLEQAPPTVLADPSFTDRGDGTLVNHYLCFVRPRQYFFLDNRIVELLQRLVFENEIVRDVICSVASVHKRRSREEIMGPRSAGSTSSGGSTTPSPDRLVLVLPKGDTPDATSVVYHERTQQILKAYAREPSKLTKAEAMAGLQYVSSVLFEGGFGDWDEYLSDIACAWVETNVLAPFKQTGDAYLIDRLSRMTREDELGSFVVRTTMWFEVLASVTMVRTPRFLDVYRKLFEGARVVEIDGVATEADFSMLQVMGCDNITFLALAEISALAAWKERETKAQTLSSVELVKRGSYIESHYLTNNAESGISEASAGTKDDSLENRRRLTADIFRASARLYLHTVLSGDKPSVREISEGVRETVDALKRVPTQRDSELRRSVVRSVVFPICLAGCMTDDEGHRRTLRDMLEVEGGAGNCGAVVKVMEVVWTRRAAMKRSRGSKHEDVSWRDVVREEKVPLLLV